MSRETPDPSAKDAAAREPAPKSTTPAAPLPQPGSKAYVETFPRDHFMHLPALKFRLGSFMVDLTSYGFIGPEKWWRNWLHAHTYYEICYAFAGRGTFKMLGEIHQIAEGDLFIAKPQEDHEIISDEVAPLGVYFWSYTLLPAPRGKTPPDPADAALDRLLHAFIDSKRWVNAHVPGVKQTLELLTEEAVRREAGLTRLAEGLARKLIVETARAALDDAIPAEAVEPRFKDPAQALAAQALRYIRDNYQRALTVRDIAAQVNLSERHFNRLFQKATGHSPVDALTDARLEAAAQLLLDRQIPIKEIAERVGYPDVRYFTTVFRKKMGAPPAEYRENGGTKYADPERGTRAKPGHFPPDNNRRI